MNTLSRHLTASIVADAAAYAALRRQWSAVVNSQQRATLTPAHYLLYLALLGRDWRAAFTPITNRRRLDNGAIWAWGLFRALRGVRNSYREADLLAPFGDLVTPEQLARVRALLPEATPTTYPVDT